MPSHKQQKTQQSLLHRNVSGSIFIANILHINRNWTWAAASSNRLSKSCATDNSEPPCCSDRQADQAVQPFLPTELVV